MLDGIISILSGIFGFLGGFLPNDPFSDYLQTFDNLRLGLSWLNWFFPIGQMLALLALWIGACVLITAVRVAIDLTGGVGSKMIG